MKITMLILFIFCCLNNLAHSKDSIIVQSTTSTKNSGFYDFILPKLKKDTGINIHVVAVGTGAAIKNAMNCDGDVLLVHSPKREIKFVNDGFSKKRNKIMYNDFVLVGPSIDPAEVTEQKNVIGAFKEIAKNKILFASRGDNSGTHSKEKIIWEKSGIVSQLYSGKWYRETGSGMGTTINVAIGMGGYTLADRATWIKFANKRDFKVLFQGDKILFNQYAVMLISKSKCPTVKSETGKKFVDWLISNRGQKTINSYKVKGKQLFFGNANNN